MPDQDKSFAPPNTSGDKRKDHDIKDRPGKTDPNKEERLDEGLEETFPASDPVAAHHIT